MPQTSVNIVLTISEDDLLHRARGELKDQLTAYVIGPHTTPNRIDYSARHNGVLITIPAIAAPAVLHMPLREIAGQVVELEHVVPTWKSLADQLATIPTWRGRFRMIDEALMRRVDPAFAATGVMEAAVRIIEQTRGRVPIHTLARIVEWSRRRLLSHFDQRMGMSPKLYARITRFRAIEPELAAGPKESYANLAAAAGYADQAHFNKEIRVLTGYTPRQYKAASTAGAARCTPQNAFFLR